MLREYEFTYISKPDIAEADKAAHFEKYEQLLLKDGGQVVKKADWGVKKLQFPIKKNYRGHYMHYDYVGKPENLAEAERLMRIDENILRFMSIKIGENVDVEARKVEVEKRDAFVAQRKQSDTKGGKSW